MLCQPLHASIVRSPLHLGLEPLTLQVHLHFPCMIHTMRILSFGNTATENKYNSPTLLVLLIAVVNTAYPALPSSI